MLQFFFGTVAGWIGTTVMLVAAAVAVGWFFPRFRLHAAGAAAVAWAAVSIYAKGSRDRARLEKERRDEAVRRAQAKYDEIAARPDTDDDVARRLRDGTF